MEQPVFDMIVVPGVAAECVECHTPQQRGAVVWKRTFDSKPVVYQVVCARCAAADLIPRWDDEQKAGG